MNIKQAIAKLLENESLTKQEMTDVMNEVMTGIATDAQIGGFLIALRVKGESVDEITAAAQVMRDLATPVAIDADNLVDIVGTGGDGSSTFNISTASCFVVAAAGGHVAKHVKYRSYCHFFTRANCVLHSTVMHWCKHKANTKLFNTSLNHVRAYV